MFIKQKDDTEIVGMCQDGNLDKRGEKWIQ